MVLRKRTEASFGVVTFSGFNIVGESGQREFISALDSYDFQEKRQDERRIEFIGDSISCGYGIEGRAPCSFSPATENSGLYSRHSFPLRVRVS